ncbi:MAG: class I SAM-dependent methyltransferase [Clostridiales bacterium]|nr:class I SAM-dependent methyltransferase [Clostridiales bacterium]
MEQRYDNILAAAYVRGAAIQGKVSVSDELLHKKIHSLEPSELERLIEAGSRAGLKMYRFKNHEELPRVKSALGILRGLQPETLLDVGSGRGVFLFPFLKTFPDVQVTSVDLLIHRVEFLKNLHDGGIENLTALQQDICCWDMADHSFDIVTMLEVLEHIPNVSDAVKAAVRLAKRYVLISVPSKPDNNPEHIHLLTKDVLAELFYNAGCTRLQFSGVNGHLILLVSLEQDSLKN